MADPYATAATLDKIVGHAAVHAVVNNVGFARFGRLGSIELDHLFDTYDLNVRAAVQVVQTALPGMLDAEWGRIVNVTSLTTLGTPERTRTLRPRRRSRRAPASGRASSPRPASR